MSKPKPRPRVEEVKGEVPSPPDQLDALYSAIRSTKRSLEDNSRQIKSIEEQYRNCVRQMDDERITLQAKMDYLQGEFNRLI